MGLRPIPRAAHANEFACSPTSLGARLGSREFRARSLRIGARFGTQLALLVRERSSLRSCGTLFAGRSSLRSCGNAVRSSLLVRDCDYVFEPEPEPEPEPEDPDDDEPPDGLAGGA